MWEGGCEFDERVRDDRETSKPDGEKPVDPKPDQQAEAHAPMKAWELD